MGLRIPEYNRRVQQGSISVNPVDAGPTTQALELGVKQRQQLSEGIGQAGKAANTILVDYAKGLDEAIAQDHVNELRASEAIIRKELSSKVGKQVMEGDKPISDLLAERYKQQVEELGSKLSTPYQKELFAQKSNTMLQSFKEDADSHVTKQLDIYGKSVMKAQADAGVETIASNYFNPKLVQQGISDAYLANRTLSMKAGKSQEEADLDALRSVSGGLTVGVSRFLDSNDIGSARKFINENEKFFTGEDRHKVEQMFKSKATGIRANALADKLTSDITSVTAFMERTKQIKDPDLRDAVESKGLTNLSIKERAFKENNDQAFLTAFSSIKQNPIKGVDGIPEMLRQQIGDDSRKVLKDTSMILSGAKQPTPKMETYQKLSTMSQGELGRMSQADLLKHFPDLSQEQFDAVSSKWQLARRAGSGDAEASAKWKSMMSDEEMITNELKRAKFSGFDTLVGEPSKKDNEKQFIVRDEFLKKLDAASQVYFLQTGKNMSDMDKQNFLRSQINEEVKNKVMSRGWLSDSEITITEAMKQDGDYYVPSAKIPSEWIAKFSASVDMKNKSESERKKLTEEAYFYFKTNQTEKFRKLIGK